MTVIPAMESFAGERHGPFDESARLVQSIKANLRVLGYGG